MYKVSVTMGNNDIPLWTPLVDPRKPAEAIRRNRNTYLHSGLCFDEHTEFPPGDRVPKYSKRFCEAPFMNSSGLLNSIFREPTYADAWRRCMA